MRRGKAGGYVLDHVLHDESCGDHTIWLAQRTGY